MLYRRLATLLAVLLVAVGGIGILWSIVSTITNPAYPVTVIIGLGLVAVVVAKGFTDAKITSTPYW